MVSEQRLEYVEESAIWLPGGKSLPGRGNSKCKALRQEQAGAFEEQQGDQYSWNGVSKGK